MKEIFSTVSTALNEAIDFMGEPIVVGTRIVNGVVNQVEFTEDLMEGGRLSNRGITVVIRGITPLPEIGSAVLYKGKRFRIEEVNEDAAGVEMVCATDSK